jgi:tRNA threonylcarbamoyl adenosine modification protein YeaZ
MITRLELGFVLDTSSPILTLGLSDFKLVEQIVTLPLGRDISSLLQQEMQAFLSPYDWSDLAWVAVVVGPGSYTGVRLGVVTARTLAQSLSIPVFGFSGLAIAAATVSQDAALKTSSPIAISRPAQRGHVYGGLYQVRWSPTDRRSSPLMLPEPVLPDRNYPLAEWSKIVADHGATAIAPPFDTDELYAQTLGKTLLVLAQGCYERGDRPDWHTVLPSYG